MKLIKTKKEYLNALIVVEAYLEAGVKKGSNEGNELEVLLLLIDQYEEKHYKIDAPDPVAAILFRMDQMNLKPKDLEPLLGNKSIVSKILNKQRTLSLSMIRAINKALKIPTDILVQEY